MYMIYPELVFEHYDLYTACIMIISWGAH